MQLASGGGRLMLLTSCRAQDSPRQSVAGLKCQWGWLWEPLVEGCGVHYRSRKGTHPVLWVRKTALPNRQISTPCSVFCSDDGSMYLKTVHANSQACGMYTVVSVPACRLWFWPATFFIKLYSGVPFVCPISNYFIFWSIWILSSLLSSDALFLWWMGMVYGFLIPMHDGKCWGGGS